MSIKFVCQVIPSDKVQSFFSQPTVSLEENTNLIGAMESAVNLMLTTQEKLRNAQEPTDAQFVVVMLTDGCETMHTDAEGEIILNRLSKMVSGASLNILFRAITIGKHADTKLVMKCKNSIETSYSYENQPLLYARTRSEIPKLVQQMISELADVCGMTVRIPEHEYIPLEGLVRNMYLPASSECTVVVAPGQRINLLWRGPPSRSLRVGSSYNTMLVVDNTSWFDDVRLQSRLLGVLRRTVDDICVASVAGRPVQDAVKQIRELIEVEAQKL